MMDLLPWATVAILAWPALWFVHLGIRGLRIRPGDLRARARADLTDWVEWMAANPGHADSLRRPAVLSRYLGDALGRPALQRREVRRRAWRTLRCLRGWWGAFVLNRLAWDCTAWSLLGADEAGRGSGRTASGR